mmetsp:Transcript_165159/g.524736  ORF Transcript_165159/g.524736 Transcript_165159/m.524736 type:complete len:224 (-) Transcript_165159:143-814(-)
MLLLASRTRCALHRTLGSNPWLIALPQTRQISTTKNGKWAMQERTALRAQRSTNGTARASWEFTGVLATTRSATKELGRMRRRRGPPLSCCPRRLHARSPWHSAGRMIGHIRGAGLAERAEAGTARSLEMVATVAGLVAAMAAVGTGSVEAARTVPTSEAIGAFALVVDKVAAAWLASEEATLTSLQPLQVRSRNAQTSKKKGEVCAEPGVSEHRCTEQTATN